MRKLTLLLVVVLLAIAPIGLQIRRSQGDKVSITFWHMEQPPARVQRYQELIDEFNAAHPDIEVKQEVQDWNAVYQKLSPPPPRAGSLT